MVESKSVERVCEDCNGSGKVANRWDTHQIPCQACNGRGKHTLAIETELCPHCGGAL